MPKQNSTALSLWTRYDYEDGTTAWQRECEKCDKGLLLAPARFCPTCGGSGFIVTWTRPVEVPA